MELHNPPKLHLPPLKVKRNVDREAIEKSDAVTCLIRSKQLLDLGFNKLCSSLYGISDEIQQLTALAADGVESASFQVVPTNPRPQITDFYPKPLTYNFFLDDEFSRSMSAYLKGPLEKQHVRARAKLRRKLVSLSNKAQGLLSRYENETGQDLAILSSRTLFFCKACYRVASIGRFRMRDCRCGASVKKMTDVVTTTVHHLGECTMKFIKHNYWLEHGVASLLRKHNMNTLVGYYVLGHSGTWHELDIIAESRKESSRFFCECKNREVKVNDVFVLFGKMSDVGGIRGYVFTTVDRPSIEIVRLARSKNIGVVANVLTLEGQAIAEGLKEI